MCIPPVAALSNILCFSAAPPNARLFTLHIFVCTCCSLLWNAGMCVVNAKMAVSLFPTCLVGLSISYMALKPAYDTDPALSFSQPRFLGNVSLPTSSENLQQIRPCRHIDRMYSLLAPLLSQGQLTYGSPLTDPARQLDTIWNFILLLSVICLH